MKTQTFTLNQNNNPGHTSTMARFTGWLVLYQIPFTFNGKDIEFTASPNFIPDMMEIEPIFQDLKFETKTK